MSQGDRFTGTGVAEMELTNAVGAAGWRLFRCAETSSTNDLARELHPWNAVRADIQRAGRGRFGRSFVCDRGGLWISAVLPAEGGSQKWAGFSLVVGCYLIRMLRELQVPGARLRWPNDLMARRRKLAGLLIEQASSGALIVGLGLNVTNQPWTLDPELAAISTSLAKELPAAPSLDAVTVRVLDALADAHEAMLTGGMEAGIRELNEHWSEPVNVRISLTTGGVTTGRFTGLDPRGHLRLLDDNDAEFLVEHQSVEKLVELD